MKTEAKGAICFHTQPATAFLTAADLILPPPPSKNHTHTHTHTYSLSRARPLSQGSPAGHHRGTEAVQKELHDPLFHVNAILEGPRAVALLGEEQQVVPDLMAD